MPRNSFLKSIGLLLITLLIFVGLNWLASLYYDRAPNPVVEKYGSAYLEKVYPGKSQQEIGALLSETWGRPYLYEPFTQFKESPYRGGQVNVDERGFRFSADQAAWPPVPTNINVFVFGGSTTFGYGLPNSETVPSRMQEEFRKQLGAPVAVYNFGRGYYYSTQERILFEQLLLNGHVPNVVVFIDGINDFFQETDEPVYTPQLQGTMSPSPSSMIKLIIGKVLYRATQLPIVRAANDLTRSLGCLFGTCQQAGGQNVQGNAVSADPKFRDPKVLAAAIERYFANKKMIEAVATAYNVKPIFVWQPSPTYKYNQQNHYFAGPDYGKHGRSIYGYAAMQEAITKTPPGANFLWCADIQENVNDPLYVDQMHYTAAFSQSIASCVATLVKDRRLLDNVASSQRRP